MKAIILAGGNGSRLYPLTQVVSKQLQAVYDKPMIYYPLTGLIAAGIREVGIITTPHDQERFRSLLRDGSQWGVEIEYRKQERPRGIADAFLLAGDFVGDQSVALMLGDNIFFGGDAFPRAMADFSSGAFVFAYQVKRPQDYGVVEFDDFGRALSIEEKPAKPKSHFAVPGIYLYDNQVVDIAKSIKPSARGELEITDINQVYLGRGELFVRRLSRGFVWLDAGTSGALQEASAYIETIERRQGVKLGCPEEAALTRGFVTLEQFDSRLEEMPDCEYRDYLQAISADLKRSEHRVGIG